MKFDVVVISEDKYLIDALKQEFLLVGCTCGAGISDISEESVVVFDTSSGEPPYSADNDTVYIFSSDVPSDLGNAHTIFTKPFSVEALVLTVLGLKNNKCGVESSAPAFSITVSDTFLVVCGKRIDLTQNEMIIFNALWMAKGNAVGREHLDKITGANSNGNMVTVYINRLREKLSSATEKKIIVTVRDKGYMIPNF